MGAEKRIDFPADPGTGEQVLMQQGGKKFYVVGSTVPTDGAAGYAKGCIFIDREGTAGSCMYHNEGSATSCDFNAI